VLTISYHSGDPYANQHATDRDNYYSVSGTPTVKLDGNYSLVGGMTTGNKYLDYRSYFDQRKTVESPLEIVLTCTYDSATRTGDLGIKLKNTTASEVSGQLQVALCESHIYCVWKDLDSLHHVERNMLPDAAGEAVTIPAGDSLSKSRNYTVDAAWVARNCDLIVFVQNNSTKEVYQGAHIGVYQAPALEYRGYQSAFPAPGGDANLTLGLRNLGTADAATVSGTLSTSDPYVTVTTANADFGSIAIAQDGYATTPFSIHVDAACPDKHLATMDLAVTAAGGYSTSVSFPLHITTGYGFADDMESGENGWTHSGVADNWYQTGNRSQSPANSWYCGVDGSFKYTNQNDARLLTPYFTSGSAAQLRFGQWTEVATGDYCALEVNNGSKFWDLQDYYNGASGSWEERVNPLPDRSGQTIRTRLRFLSGYSGTAEGWYIDDFLCEPFQAAVAEPKSAPQFAGAKLAVRSPAFRSAGIAYSVPPGRSARLAAFDVNGRLVAEVGSHLTGAGQVTWSLAGVKAGTYFVRLADRVSSQVAKLVVTE